MEGKEIDFIEEINIKIITYKDGKQDIKTSNKLRKESQVIRVLGILEIVKTEYLKP